MKKSLIACACMVASLAQAQTSGATQEKTPLSVYGLVDLSVQSVSRGDSSANAGTPVNGKVSGAVDTSRLGARLDYALDGGDTLGAVVEASILNNAQTNGVTTTGTTLNSIFDRGAYLSYGNPRWGRLDFGYAPNPLINVVTVPMGGNSVNVATAYAMNFTEFYNTSSLTYSTPNLSGFRGQLQYGAPDQIPATNVASTTTNKLTSAGAVVAGIADYANGPLGLSLAAQHRAAGTAGAGTAANPNTPEKTTIIAAVRYATGSLKLGASYWQNAVNSDAANTVSAYTINAWQLGFSYGFAKDWTGGASYSSNSVGSNMTNVQLQYALNKSTTIYTQINGVNNSDAATRSSGGYGSFFTVNAPSVANLTPFGVNNGSATAVGAGVIYRF